MSIRNALVVDDSKSSRFALRRLLEGFGCNVDTAASVAEAYGMMRDRRPQIMLLDHLMPDINGLDALAEMRDDPEFSTVPVVICSSNEGHEFVSMAEARGAAAVLRKPPTPEEVRTVLEYVNSLNLAAARAVAAAPLPIEVIEPISEAAPEATAALKAESGGAAEDLTDDLTWDAATAFAEPKAASETPEWTLAEDLEPAHDTATLDFPEFMPDEPAPAMTEDAIVEAEFSASSAPASAPELLDFESLIGPDEPLAAAAEPVAVATSEPAPHIDAPLWAAAMETVEEIHAEPVQKPAAPIEAQIPAPTPMTPVPAYTPPSAAVASSSRNEELRDEFEKRLRRVTQDLFVNIAEIRSQLSNHEAFLEFREPQMAQQIRGLEARLDQLASDQTTSLQLIRSEIDARLGAHEERMVAAMRTSSTLSSLNLEDIRREAREEARKVAEQTAREAAAAMSERLAQSILGALRPTAS